MAAACWGIEKDKHNVEKCVGECRETKPKVIMTLANHKLHKQLSELAKNSK